VLNPLFSTPFDQLILTARVATAAGDAGLRARVLRSLELLEPDSREVPLFPAVGQYTRGLLERDAGALVDAAARLRGIRPLLSASASEDAGAELAHAGGNADAIDELNAAFDLYVACEATADARRVRHALRHLGVERRMHARARPRTGWESLSDAEMRVVHLVTDGATNAAVGERLHLSPNTVKTHIRKAFGKLGINSRAQLTELMVRDAGATPEPPPPTA
jgi:DNA-binding CsgD family transcriptional regulator